ncbi:MAG: hypothetical protein WD118_00460 [Phycisphaeraceae bacterium]
MTTRSLDVKLERILADPACGEFILADAKDADMAHGMAAPGRSPEHHAHEGRFRTLDEYRQLIRENVAQGLVDIMLMSASTNDVLTLRERLFDGSHVTPAIRANDTTDIWLAAGAVYAEQPARPFRSATIDHAMCGKVHCEPHERSLGANLGLYSVTFNNDLERDLQTLERYAGFRAEAEAKGFRHFLEVFEPNAPQAAIPELPRFLNDMIVRTLAGVAGKGRPVFLKVPYHGPAAMEQLAGYDRSLIVGILGGSSGTTFDAFHQLWEARRHGARVALYGRMINNAEHQSTFIRYLRALAHDEIAPAEAVRAYHGDLATLGITPYRTLNDDLQPTLRASSYDGPAAVAVPALPAGMKQANGDGGSPDFTAMSQADKVRWNLERWRKVLD